VHDHDRVISPITLFERRITMRQRPILSQLCSAAIVLVLGSTAVAALPGLIGYWTLDEGQGKTARDASGNGLDGTLNGNPKWVAGQLGGALDFDGSDDFVDIPHDPRLSLTDAITIAAWTNMRATASGEMAIVSKGGWGANDLPYELTETPGDVIFWQFYNDSGRDTCSPTSPPVGEWHHIAATYDGKIFKCYVDGKLGEEWAYAGKMPKNTASVTIGRRSRGGTMFNGMIDDVAIYDRALSLDEVQLIMGGHLQENPLAYSPAPRDGAMIEQTWTILQWRAGDFAKLHEAYFGDSYEKVSAATPAETDIFIGRQAVTTLSVGTAGSTIPVALVPGKTYYWRIDEVNDANSASPWKGNVWSFRVRPQTAWKPYPPDGMKYVDPNQDLSWEKGLGAVFYTLYLGRTFDEVNTATTGGMMVVGTPYEPSVLALDTTYYWRVDAFAFPANVTYKGPVCSFTTRGTGGGVKAQYFTGIDVSGTLALTRIEGSIDHAWAGAEVIPGASDNVSARWTANLEAPFTETYNLITTSDDGVRLWFDGRLVIDNWTDHGAADDSVEVDLIGGQVYSVRMEWYESGGDAVAQLSWESPSLPRQIIGQGWLQLPTKATSPYPANTAVDVQQAVTLRWAPGDQAASHDIYFGSDKDAVAAGTTPAARQGREELIWNPGVLEWGQTYYWRVDEVNAAEADSPWKGVVWSFTTADFLVVDDFESYTDEVGSRVFQTWLDGFGYTEPTEVAGNGTGATVGYLQPPFAELRIVHGGYQSMPMDYNNVNAPYYSEAERTWTTPQNWTVKGVNTLVLYVRGQSSNGAGPLYVAIQDSAGHTGVVIHADPAAVTSADWLEWKIPFSRFTGVNAAAIRKMYIGVGNRAAPAQGGAGSLYIDDIRVTKP
jgi:hypothetical protein